MKEIKNSKNKNNAPTLAFDAGEERIDRSIQKRMNEGDYFSALRLMNRRNEFFKETVDSCAVQSDLYELLEANSQALKTWYRFLNICEQDSLAEAYEGLAVNYMNLGRESQAAYYYNLLLRVDDELTEESKMDIIEMFSKSKKDFFRTVYPPEKADFSEEIDKGLRALKEGNFALAHQNFSRVEQGAKHYKAAQNLIAVTFLLEDKKDEAALLCKHLLSQDEYDVQANTTYAALLGQSNRQDEAREVAKKLLKIKTSDTDELYKIATVCCENNLHEAALEKFMQLEKDIRCDGNLMYFKGVAAFKSGKIDLAIDTFEKLLTVYPEAAVARYYYDVLRYYVENRDKADIVAPELSYFYRLPTHARENYCELLYFLNKLTVNEAKIAIENRQVLNVLQWCFDEMDGVDGDLQMLAICVAVRCRYEKFLQEILLNPEVLDVVKIRALHLIAEQNREVEYGVTVYHIFRRIHFFHIRIGAKKRKKFLQAYASVYAKFVIVSEKYAAKICAAAELVYHCLMQNDRMDYIDRPQDVSCVIYMLAGIREAGNTVQKAAALFEADIPRVLEILNLLQSKTAKAKEEGEKPLYYAGKED